MSDVDEPSDELSGEETDEAVFKRASEESPQESQSIPGEEQDMQDEVWTESEQGAPEQPVRPLPRAAEPPHAEKKVRRRAPSFFWPIVLIGAG